MLQRRSKADATSVLDALDLQEPNEFDEKLLEVEGRDFAGVRVRGGRVVARSAARATATSSSGTPADIHTQGPDPLRTPHTAERSGVRALPAGLPNESSWMDDSEALRVGAYRAVDVSSAPIRLDTGRLRAARERGRALLESGGRLPTGPDPIPTPVYWAMVTLGIASVAALLLAVAAAIGLIG